MAANLQVVISAVDRASGALDGINKKAGRLGSTFGKVLKVGALAAAGGIAATIPIAITSVKAASELEEAVNKAAVTFGKAVGPVTEFAETSARKFGISRRAANEYAGTLGVILQASGLSQEATAGMSVDLTKLAADLASFNNIPIDQALEKIRSGLVGEAEPLRTVGVLLSAAAVKAKAYEEGIAAQGAELTEAQKVQARYALILEQTQQAQGDFARTSDSLANRQRILSARFEDLRARIGQKLLPVGVKFFGLLLSLVDVIEKRVVPAVEKFVDTELQPFLKNLLPTLRDVGKFIRTDVLPQLQSFGRAAASIGGALTVFLLPALDTLRDAWLNIGQPISAVLLPLLQRVGQFLLDHKTLLIAVAGAILLIVNPWLLVVAALVVVLAKWDEISAVFTETIPDAIDSLIAKVQGIPVIGAIFTDTFNTAKAIVETAFKLIVAHIEFALDTIKNAFAFWKAIFSGDWDRAWQAVKDQAAAVWELIKGSFGALLDGFGAILKSKLELLKTVGKDIGGAILDGLEAALEATGGVGKGFANAIIDFINDTIRKINKAIPDKIALPGLPDINLPDNPIPTIPRLEQGGDVLRTGLAVVHRGERFSGVEATTTAGVTLHFGAGSSLIGTIVTDGDLSDPIAQRRFAQNVRTALRGIM